MGARKIHLPDIKENIINKINRDVSSTVLDVVTFNTTLNHPRHEAAIFNMLAISDDHQIFALLVEGISWAHWPVVANKSVRSPTRKIHDVKIGVPPAVHFILLTMKPLKAPLEPIISRILAYVWGTFKLRMESFLTLTEPAGGQLPSRLPANLCGCRRWSGILEYVSGNRGRQVLNHDFQV